MSHRRELVGIYNLREDPRESSLFKQTSPTSDTQTMLKSVPSPDPRDLTAPRKAQVGVVVYTFTLGKSE